MNYFKSNFFIKKYKQDLIIFVLEFLGNAITLFFLEIKLLLHFFLEYTHFQGKYYVDSWMAFE
jgi:hypothetical protein